MSYKRRINSIIKSFKVLDGTETELTRDVIHRYVYFIYTDKKGQNRSKHD